MQLYHVQLISAGAYVLGFRLDPIEQLKRMHQQLEKIHQLFAEVGGNLLRSARHLICSRQFSELKCRLKSQLEDRVLIMEVRMVTLWASCESFHCLG